MCSRKILSQPVGAPIGRESHTYMKNKSDNNQIASATLKTPGGLAGFSLEIAPSGHGESFRLPVHLKNLAAEGVILEVDLPPGLSAETLVDQTGTIHMAPDGFSKETELRSKVAWVRSGERGPAHFLLGMDLGAADFRSRRALENLLARPKDISNLWTYWDQVQTKPPASSDCRFIVFVGAGALLGGVGLQFILPESYHSLAYILTLFGIYTLAGKCVWNWWQKRGTPKGVENQRA
jgi:hypothetical protein